VRNIYSYFVLLIFLSSCGGGGGGGSSDSPIGGGSSTPTISVTISSSAQSAEVNSSVTITWSSTSATSCSASGAWSGTKPTSGSESVIIGLGGSNNFSLTCSAPGANSGSNSVSVNGIRYIAGTVFDGYIRGASIFIDENNNLTADENETVITSDNNGNFSDLLYANGSLVSVGGFDLDTGADLSNLTLVNELTGFEATKLISPFTTLIAYLQDSSNLNEILGIDPSIDLMNVDPIPLLGEGIYDYMYEKGNQLTVLSYSLQNFFDDENSQVYFQAIANELEEQFNSNQVSIDIESSSFINEVIDEAEELKSETIAQETEANLRTVISAVLPTLRVHAESTTTTAVQRFAFNTLQDDLKDSSTLTNSASTTLQKYQNEIYAYIASVESIEESLINPDFNVSPVITSPTSFSVNENQLSIGTISATDLDGDSLIFSVSGSEISISGSGVMTFVSSPDYETKSSYSVTVTVSDGVASVTQTININILDVDESAPNQAPTISSSASFSADENQTSIGSVVASDADGDSLTYSISGSEINISGTGVLTFSTPPDYETKNSYSATVTVSDGSDSVTQNISVSITDINELGSAPVISSSSIFTADENQTAIGSIVSSDADGDSLTYSISGSEINISSSGLLTFATAPDYETKDSYTATVTVSDGNNSVIQTITVNIVNLNDNVPIFIFPNPNGQTNINYQENSSTSVLTPQVNDADGDTLTFDLIGTDAGSFNINSQTGEITFKSSPDYEQKNTYSLGIRANSPGANTSVNFDISITDLALTFSSSSTFSADENQISIGSVTVSDIDGQSVSFSISGSEINISNSGVLTFVNAPDYETKNTYTAIVTATDGTTSPTQTITVNINDVSEASNQLPVITSSATFNTPENQCSALYVIGTVTATDADGQSLSYSISGTDLTISNTGQLIWNTSLCPLDFEGTNSYTATVTVNDSIDEVTQNITVNLTNVDEGPVMTSPNPNGSTVVSVSENVTGIVYTPAATDPEGDAITWSISGTDSTSFNIDSSTGAISFSSSPDYETKTNYSITVRASTSGPDTSAGMEFAITDESLANDTDPLTLNGTAGSDTLQGGAGDDTINGLGANDLLSGGGGDDVISGGDGDDNLNGEAGDDILWGGVGQDALRGGSGADQYAIQSGEGSSSLNNVSYVPSNEFIDGTDKILLKTGLSFGDLTIRTATGNDAANNPQVEVNNTLISEVNSGNKYLLIIQNSSAVITSDDFVTE
jgi:hypothetical protein